MSLFHPPGNYVATLVIICLITFAQLIICFVSIKQFFVTSNQFYHKWTILVMIMYTLSNIGDIGHVVYRYKFIPNEPNVKLTESIIIVVVNAMYFIGNIMLYALLLRTIYSSFRLHQNMVIVIIMLIMTSFASCIYYCYDVISTEDGTIYYESLTNSVIIWLACDVTLNITLFSLLLYKLKRNETIEGVEIYAASIGASYSESVETYYQKSIANALVKHCILFIPLLLIKNAFYISVFVQGIVHSDNPYTVYGYIIRAIENVCTIFILWLALRVNNLRYNKLCKCMHTLAIRYCIKFKDFKQSLISDRDRDRSSLLRRSSYMGGHQVYVTNKGDSYDEKRIEDPGNEMKLDENPETPWI